MKARMYGMAASAGALVVVLEAFMAARKWN